MRSIAEIDRDHEGMNTACVSRNHGCAYPACGCDRALREYPNVRNIQHPDAGDLEHASWNSAGIAGVQTGDGAERRIEAAIEKLRRCRLGCGPFGQCKAAMNGVPNECANSSGNGGVPGHHPRCAFVQFNGQQECTCGVTGPAAETKSGQALMAEKKN